MPDQRMSVLLVGDNESALKSFQAYAALQDDMELVAAATGDAEVLNLVRRHAPDAVVWYLDQEPDEGEDLAPLRVLVGVEHMPYLLVAARGSSETALRTVKEMGADFIQSKGLADCGPKIIVGFLRLIRPLFRSAAASGAVEEKPGDETKLEDLLRRRIGEAFDEIGLKTSHGRKYLIDAVLIQIRTQTGEVEMENNIYPALEVLYPGEKRGNMEKDMRYRIERTWSTTDKATLARSYTKYVSARKRKPELAEFISYYANKFRR